MMGLAGCELFRVLTTPVQFPCRTTVSATRALFAIPDREDDRRIRSLSALRDVHYYVCPALLSRVPAFTTGRRWERRRPVAMAGALSEVSPATIVGLSTALSFVLLRAFVYFRMEYIIASMLGRHVPRGGAKVVELDIREGRNMYYYPSDTVQVVAVSSNPNRTLLENQAIKAGVPIQIKLSGASTLGLPANTMDAVNPPPEATYDAALKAACVQHAAAHLYSVTTKRSDYKMGVLLLHCGKFGTRDDLHGITEETSQRPSSSVLTGAGET